MKASQATLLLDRIVLVASLNLLKKEENKTLS
jgi:hypothetical protein